MTTGRKVAANFGWLLGGRGSAALATLAATVLTARALGTEVFGTVVLIHTTALVTRQLCRVKTAEAVIRFGVPLKEQARDADWWRLLSALFRLDVITAAITVGVAAVLVGLSTPVFGLGPALRDVAWLYLLPLGVAGASTTKGALRVLDRYVVLGVVLIAGPLVRLAGVLYAGYAGAPAPAYVLIWALGLLVEDLLVLAVGWWHLRPKPSVMAEHGLREAFDAEPGLKRFLMVIYWQSNLDVFPRHVVTLLVGGWFGTAAAGIFRLARDLSEVLGKPVALLRQAIFPDLSRLWQRDAQRFGRLTLRVCAAMFTVGGVFVLAGWLAGGPLLALLAGDPYRAGAVVLALLLGAATFELGGAVLRPASYTLGRERAVLAIQAGALAIYFPVFFTLAGGVGLAAAGWAALATAIANFVGLVFLVRQSIRNGASVPAPAREDDPTTAQQ